MRRQTLIALGIAVVLGLFAVYLANTFLTSTEQRAQVAEQGMTKVAVAVVPLDYGVDITPDKIRFADYPVASVPPGSFRTLAELLPAGKRRVALRPMLVNEPILATKISGEGQGASIAALLPDGMRAAAVRLNDVSGVAGFVLPNDSVDVLITRQPIGATSQVTDVLLQNIRVIATDQAAQSADGKPIVAKTATLEVNPVDAQKLVLAQEVGTLNLVLRKPGEQNNPVVETVSMNDLRYNMYGGARYPAPAVVGSFGSGAGGAIAGSMNRSANTIASAVARPHRPVAKKNVAPRSGGRDIEVWRGTKSDQVKVGGYGR